MSIIGYPPIFLSVYYWIPLIFSSAPLCRSAWWLFGLAARLLAAWLLVVSAERPPTHDTHDLSKCYVEHWTLIKQTNKLWTFCYSLIAVVPVVHRQVNILPLKLTTSYRVKMTEDGAHTSVSWIWTKKVSWIQHYLISPFQTRYATWVDSGAEGVPGHKEEGGGSPSHS